MLYIYICSSSASLEPRGRALCTKFGETVRPLHMGEPIPSAKRTNPLSKIQEKTGSRQRNAGGVTSRKTGEEVDDCKKPPALSTSVSR